jgi:hypothetical protein
MPFLDHQLLSLIIRWIHVGAMAFAFGGAVWLWLLHTRFLGSETLDARGALTLTVQYEFFFWGALGILIMTGVGNLGAFGAALPAPDSAWGGKFLLKMALVFVLIVFSLARTLFIARLHAAPPALSPWRRLQMVYASTALLLAVIVFTAVSLAHG